MVMLANSNALRNLGLQIYVLGQSEADTVVGKLAFAKHLQWHDHDGDGALTFPEFSAALHVIGGIPDIEVQQLFHTFATDGLLGIAEFIGQLRMTDFVHVTPSVQQKLLCFVGSQLVYSELPEMYDRMHPVPLLEFTFVLRELCQQALNDLDLELLHCLFEDTFPGHTTWLQFEEWCALALRRSPPPQSGLTSLSHTVPWPSTVRQLRDFPEQMPTIWRESSAIRNASERTSDDSSELCELLQRVEAIHMDSSDTSNSEEFHGPYFDRNSKMQGSVPGMGSALQPVYLQQGVDERLLDQKLQEHQRRMKAAQTRFERRLEETLNRRMRDYEERFTTPTPIVDSARSAPMSLGWESERRQRLESELDMRSALERERKHCLELEYAIQELRQREQAQYVELGRLRYDELQQKGIVETKQVNIQAPTTMHPSLGLATQQVMPDTTDWHSENGQTDQGNGMSQQMSFLSSAPASDLAMDVDPLDLPRETKPPPQLTSTSFRSAVRSSSLSVPSSRRQSSSHNTSSPEALSHDASSQHFSMPHFSEVREPTSLEFEMESVHDMPTTDTSAPPVTKEVPNVLPKSMGSLPPGCPPTTLLTSPSKAQQEGGTIPAKVQAVLARPEFQGLRKLPLPQLRRMFGKWDKKKMGCISLHGFTQLILDSQDQLSDITDVQMERVFLYFCDPHLELLTWDQFAYLVQNAVAPPMQDKSPKQPSDKVAPPSPPTEGSPQVEAATIPNPSPPPVTPSYPLRPELLLRPEFEALRQLPIPQLRHLFKQHARDLKTVNRSQFADLVRTSTAVFPTLSEGQLEEVYRHFADPVTGFMPLDRFLKCIQGPDGPSRQASPRRGASPERGKGTAHILQQAHEKLLNCCYNPRRSAPIQGTVALLQYGKKAGVKGRVAIGDFASLTQGLKAELSDQEVDTLFQHHSPGGGLVDWERFVEQLRLQQRLGLSGPQFHRLLGVIRKGFQVHGYDPLNSDQMLAMFQGLDPNRTGKITLRPFTQVIQTKCNQRLTDYEIELVFNRLANPQLQHVKYLDIVDALASPVQGAEVFI